MKYEYRTSGVCAKEITFEIENGKIHDVKFMGGCNGNLKAISKLVEGMEPENVIRILKGNTCGLKRTSCADQLALALEQAEGK